MYWFFQRSWVTLTLAYLATDDHRRIDDNVPNKKNHGEMIKGRLLVTTTSKHKKRR
jgi:hypothetical protein